MHVTELGCFAIAQVVGSVTPAVGIGAWDSAHCTVFPFVDVTKLHPGGNSGSGTLTGTAMEMVGVAEFELESGVGLGQSIFIFSPACKY